MTQGTDVFPKYEKLVVMHDEVLKLFKLAMYLLGKLLAEVIDL